jgi:NAD-dependent deacetylase
VTYLQRAADLFCTARRPAALTGAGISTPSGIPDFRSRGTGLWEHYDPMQVASLMSFRYDPQAFFAWIRPMAERMVQAEPNAAHLALARLEAAGKMAGVVTQNIDNLHRRAGSKCVYEVHGHMRTATCGSCYRQTETGELLAEFSRTGNPPRCSVCGGFLKPDVVLYGEQLPEQVLRQAESLLDSCDLLLVAGSSLEVTPAALLPHRALEAGARLIIVNQEPTYLDVRADVVFHEDVIEILPPLADEVLRA